MSQVVVVPYNPQWVQEFEDASGEIKSALGDNLLEIHHIGGTSISGIHAKPVIDMLPVVADIDVVDLCNARMVALGYDVRGEFGLPGRRYFPRNNAAGGRSHQAHVYQTGSPEIARHLAFRDFMRAHSALAQEYSDLKRKLAEAHPDDINAYMDGKDEFIKAMETRALAWVAAGRPLPP